LLSLFSTASIQQFLETCIHERSKQWIWSVSIVKVKQPDPFAVRAVEVAMVVRSFVYFGDGAKAMATRPVWGQ
jgi:hypothetical protein